jgi:hypothetical protein
MSFHLGSWLRGLCGQPPVKRLGSTGTTLPQKDKRRRCGLRSYLKALEPQETSIPGLTSFAAGACSLLNNDSDPNAAPITMSTVDRSSLNGGAVAVNPDGTFTYAGIDSNGNSATITHRPVWLPQRQQQGQRHRDAAWLRHHLCFYNSRKGGTACHPPGGSGR